MSIIPIIKKFRLASNLNLLPDLGRYIERVAADGGTVENNTAVYNYLLAGVKPKLAMIPSGKKVSKLYSIYPTTGDGDMTVVRADNTAYRMNASGVIELVNANIPVISYYNGVASLIVLPQRTNIFRDSSPASDPGQGTRTNVAFAANNWGIGLAGKVILDNAGGTVDCSFNDVAAGAEIGVQITCSAVFKNTDNSQFTYGIGGDGAFIFGALTNYGTLVKNEHIGNNCYFVVAQAVVTSLNNRVGVRKASTFTSKVTEVSAMQVVVGNLNLFLADYIKTTGTAVTRNADVITVTTPIEVSTITETFYDDTTNVITTIPATYQVSQGRIKKIVMT